jgi:hypothetical protein
MRRERPSPPPSQKTPRAPPQCRAPHHALIVVRGVRGAVLDVGVLRQANAQHGDQPRGVALNQQRRAQPACAQQLARETAGAVHLGGRGAGAG